jgi:hypothetical protein
MTLLLWARLVFPILLVALVAFYAWTAYEAENRE